MAGAAALLLDLGVPNAVAVKALLINAAMRNPGAATWSDPVGWGFMRLGDLPKLLLRTDKNPVCEEGLLANAYASACVTDTLIRKGDERFFEGSIEGQFKATLVWNRHFTNAKKNWADTNPPLPIDKLSLSLYHQEGLTFASVDVNSNTPKDNVQQVNGKEANLNKILVKVKLTSIPVTIPPLAPYGLAFSTALKPVKAPSLGISCVVPPKIQPLQMIAVACTASNAGELPVSSASANANPGTVANGSLGTIPAAGKSAAFTVNVTAPSLNSPPLPVTVNVAGTLADETYTASTVFAISPTGGDCGTIVVSPNPALHPIPKAGESGTLSLTTGLADCQWMLVIGPVGPTNTPYDPWLILSPMSGVGNATLHYTVLPNPTDAMVVGGFLAEPAPGYTGMSGGAGFVILGR